ncbi:MAG TPA: sialidase family protein [Verrucomicrobiota bacterium]|nr:sialidase family protein [Verrucomicrobiota bacterium]
MLEQAVAVSTLRPSADASAFKGLGAFLGAPLSLSIQPFWKGGGGTSIVTAQDGSVIAFQSMASNRVRRSTDGGVTWGADIEIGPGATFANAIVDESTGEILHNSREHMSRGNRFVAWSQDGGELWLDAYLSAELPDGPRGSSYGCMGGMIRLPVEGLDILLSSNLDTDAGRMPDRVGASITKQREKIAVWASFNGGDLSDLLDRRSDPQ